MAQYCIFWAEEYQIVLRAAKRSSIDPEELSARFAGLEEAAYFNLLQRYNIPMPRRPRPRNLPFPRPPRTQEQREFQRMIRFYATYQVSRLDPSVIQKFVTSENRDAMMPKLVQKFGPEPIALKDVRTRIRVFLASYNLWDKIPAVEKTINGMYNGDDEAYLRRLVAEYGAEPQEPDANESYDFRSRARRFLTLKDPAALPRLETMVQRFDGKELELMALLQRRYGKEPTEREVQEGLSKLDAVYQKAQAELKEKREKEARERAEKQRKQEESRENKMASIGVFNWDTGDVSELKKELEGGAQRAPVMEEIRTALRKGWRLKEAKCIDLVRQVLSYYNRPLTEFSERLVMNRVVTDIDERMELLAFLENLYVNEMPLSATESLRTVLSLVEMKWGLAALTEVKEKGGVDGFLGADIGAKSERTWVAFFTDAYGHTIEEELAMRNRIRLILLRNRPGSKVDELDAEVHLMVRETLIKSEKSNKPTTYLQVLTDYHGRLCARYGPEPRMNIVLDRNRVLKLLDRNAPGKLGKIEYVLQAHTYPGEGPEAALDRVRRTYGQEANSFDAIMAAFDAQELEARFVVWSHQNRLRNVFSRRLKALENPDMDVLQSVIETTAKYSDANKQQANAEAAREAAKQAQAAAAAALAAGSEGYEEAKTPEEALEMRERNERNALMTTWRADLMAITENTTHLAPLLDRHIEVEELFTRAGEFDNAIAKYRTFMDQMREEEAELVEWLRHRLVWREQWKRDEEANKEKQRRERDKQNILAAEAAEERRRKDTEAAAEAQAHFQAMQDLRENLHAQATKVLQYQAKLKSLQTRGHLGLTRNTIDVEAHRHIHDGCVFNKNPAYNTNVKPLEIVVVNDKFDYIRTEDTADDVDPTAVDKNSWEYVFKRQCRTYVEQLLKAYDPNRVSRLDDIMRRYNNKEHDLIAALEQQFDIDKSRQVDLVDRVREYYQRMAPDHMEEMDTVLRRFEYSAEHIWPFLYSQYGAHPRRRGPELREYLRVRLGTYLARVAPRLLPEVDKMIDQCPMIGCESLFRELVNRFGIPEDERQEIITVERKLKLFYARRGMLEVLPQCGAIARRFAGRYKLLNEILARTFNESLEKVTEDQVQLRGDREDGGGGGGGGAAGAAAGGGTSKNKDRGDYSAARPAAAAAAGKQK